MNNKKMKGFLKKCGALVLILGLLITLIPSMEYKADDYDLDFTKPVIEGVECLENGQTIQMGEPITLVFDAYDADSGIWCVDGEIIGEDGTKFYFGEQKDSVEDGKITFLVYADPSVSGECKIEKVGLIDYNDNITEVEVDFSFTIEKTYVADDVEISFSQESYTVSVDNKNPYEDFVMSAELTGVEEDVAYIITTFENEEGGTRELCFEFDGESFVSNESLGGALKSSTYTLKDIYLVYTGWGYAFFKEVPKCEFVFENNITDKTGPVASEVIIDKQGQFIESGEVKFTVYIFDESGIDYNDDVKIKLISPLDINEVHWVYLTEEEEGKYVGTLSVEEMYSCEWYVEFVYARDNVGNYASSNNPNLNYDDYYFFVNRNDAFVDKVYTDVNFNFYDAQNKLVKTIQKDVPRRATMEEIFGTDYINYEKHELFGEFLGWAPNVYGYKDIYTAESSVDFVTEDNTTIRLYANYDKFELSLTTSQLDENANYYTTTKYMLIDRGMTYGELLETLGKPTVPVDRDFVKWYVWMGEDDDIISESSLSIEAIYDKYKVTYDFVSIDENNNVVVTPVTDYFETGTSFKTIYETLFNKLDDSVKKNVLSWKHGMLGESDILGVNVFGGDIIDYDCIAQYQDKAILTCYYDYLKAAGVYVENASYIDYVVVSKEELNKDSFSPEKYVKELELEHHKDLIIDKLEAVYSGDNDGDGYIDSISVSYTYKNSFVRVNGRNDGIKQYIVKAGDKVELPTVYAGKQITWKNSHDSVISDGVYIVPEDIAEGETIRLTMILGDYAIETPQPEPEPTPEEKPVIKLEEEKVEEVKNQIIEAISNPTNPDSAKPEIIEVEMVKQDGTIATEVPKEILETAKGKNVEIVLDMGEYSWTINGADIKANNLVDINLEVTLDSNNIPPSKVEALAKGDETYQISLTHNGDFGFRANLTINLGKENVGQYGNLYYYDSDGKMIFMNAGKIDENGNVDLSFSHASEYVVVISDTEVTIPATGDSASVLYVGVLMLGLVLLLVSRKKKMHI